MSGKHVWVALLGGVSVIWLAGIRAGHAETPASAPAVASASVDPAHPLVKDDLAAFFDGIIPLQLERSDVAGASVLVMKDGETLLLKGYGFSDLKSKQPVDPTSTIFRLASISKLFTRISAMQLVEQGKLDLDVDVGGYLDFPIKSNNGISAPITLRNLMTHTGGFEDTTRNLALTNDKYHVGLRGDSFRPTSAWDKYFLIADVLFAIAVFLSIFTVGSAVTVWRRPATRRMSQIKFTLVGLACLFLSWFVVHWNVIGPIHRI